MFFFRIEVGVGVSCQTRLAFLNVLSASAKSFVQKTKQHKRPQRTIKLTYERVVKTFLCNFFFFSFPCFELKITK